MHTPAHAPPSSPPQGAWPGPAPQQPVATPPPPKKSRGVMWLIIGVVVLALGVAAIAVVVITRGGDDPSPAPTTSAPTTTDPSTAEDPTLTSSQLDEVFTEGSSFDGHTITSRFTSAASSSPRTNVCEQALVEAVVTAPSLIIAEVEDSSGEMQARLNAGAYGSPSAATTAYAALTDDCVAGDSGTIEHAQYFNTSYSDGSVQYPVAVVRYGNVVAMGYVATQLVGDEIAQELYTQLDGAAS